MTSPFIQGIINPPLMPEKIVSRDRLINLLTKNIDSNLIIIQSPAGYGKTILVQSFLSKQNLKFAWLNSVPELDHFYTFFNNIVYSLRQINKSFGKNTLELIDSCLSKYGTSNNQQKEINDIITTFSKEFTECCNEDIILVIDDLQNVNESEWFKTTFSTFIQNMPRNLHLILLSRQMPDIDIMPLLKEGKVFKLGMEDLIFTYNEIMVLVKDIYSIQYPVELLKLLESNLGGWVTGIHLILQSFGKEFSSISIDYQNIPENVFNMLADQILEKLDADTKNFLIVSSLLEYFNANTCNSLLGISNSDEIIKNIIDKNLFLIPKSIDHASTNGTVSYCYQILFKKFLNQKLYSIYKSSQIEGFFKKLFSYYEEKGDMLTAIEYLVRANDNEASIKAIIAHFDDLFAQGKLEYLWKWIKKMENETEMKNPYMIYYMGILYKYYAGDLNKSLEYLGRAIQIFELQKDKNGLAGCYVTKSGVLLNLGKVQEVIPELKKFLHEQTTTEIRANLLYLLALAYYQSSEYDTSVKLLNETLELSNNGDKIKKETAIYNLLGNIQLIKGNFRKSIPYYEKALTNNPNLFNRVETLCNLVLMNAQSGEYNNANNYFNLLEDIIDKYPSRMFKFPFLMTKQALLFESGEYDANIEVLEEINRLSLQMNHKQYQYISSRLLLDTYFYRKDIEKAKYYLTQSENLVDAGNELEQIEIACVKADLYDPSCSSISTKDALLKAYEYYKKNDYTYSLVQVSYKLGIYYMKNGDEEKAISYFKDAFVTAEANNYISYFIREFNRCPEYQEFCRIKNIHPEFMERLSIFTNEHVVS
jgi:ATP/maltotriose-dependent transcriptional regulator MalT